MAGGGDIAMEKLVEATEEKGAEEHGFAGSGLGWRKW